MFQKNQQGELERRLAELVKPTRDRDKQQERIIRLEAEKRKLSEEKQRLEDKLHEKRKQQIGKYLSSTNNFFAKYKGAIAKTLGTLAAVATIGGCVAIVYNGCEDKKSNYATSSSIAAPSANSYPATTQPKTITPEAQKIFDNFDPATGRRKDYDQHVQQIRENYRRQQQEQYNNLSPEGKRSEEYGKRVIEMRQREINNKGTKSLEECAEEVRKQMKAEGKFN